MLAHPLAFTHADMNTAISHQGIFVTATVKTTAATGVEMEALSAVSAALLNIYDMCKAVDDRMKISEIHLVEKTKMPPDE